MHYMVSGMKSFKKADISSMYHADSRRQSQQSRKIEKGSLSKADSKCEIVCRSGRNRRLHSIDLQKGTAPT